MDVKTIAVRRQGRVVYHDYFKVQVPGGMSDEAVLDAIQNGLNLKGRIEYDPSVMKYLGVSHEITADGRVKQLVDRFRFGVNDEIFFGVGNG